MKTIYDCETVSEALDFLAECLGEAADGGGARFSADETRGFSRLLSELAIQAERLERRAGEMPDLLVGRDLPDGIIDLVPLLRRAAGLPVEGGAA